MKEKRLPYFMGRRLVLSSNNWNYFLKKVHSVFIPRNKANKVTFKCDFHLETEGYVPLQALQICWQLNMTLNS